MASKLPTVATQTAQSVLQVKLPNHLATVLVVVDFPVRPKSSTDLLLLVLLQLVLKGITGTVPIPQDDPSVKKIHIRTHSCLRKAINSVSSMYLQFS